MIELSWLIKLRPWEDNLLSYNLSSVILGRGQNLKVTIEDDARAWLCVTLIDWIFY